MKKVLNAILNISSLIAMVIMFTFIFLVAIINYKWMAIFVILASFVASALFIAFLTIACIYGRYVIDHKKLTGFIDYMSTSKW